MRAYGERRLRGMRKSEVDVTNHPPCLPGALARPNKEEGL